MAKMESAYFAGGCFWCITPTFKETPGVSAVISGYAGGDLQNPTYKDVKTQKSGHRETIKIDFDSEQVSFDELFSIFLCRVNPFDEGGQFIDRGFSYTLAVYYTSEEQKETAAKAIHDLEQLAGMKAHISLEPYKNFFEAEEEHQDYYLKNPEEFHKELVESGRIKE